MTRVQEEPVTAFPCRGVRIEYQIFTEKDVDEVSTAHGTSRVSGLCLLDHTASQYPDIVSSGVKDLD